MGRLAGFKYREIIKRLKRLGFEFDRQAAGSHEIWFNSETGRYTPEFCTKSAAMSNSRKNLSHRYPLRSIKKV